MSLDWITVAAQLVNFLVLVWLLKRFLYRPILDGIDAREAEISARVQDANSAREAAERAEREHRKMIAKFNAEKAEMMAAARREVDEERAALQEKAQATIDREQADWRKQKKKMKADYVADLKADGAATFLSLTRKALKDLSDAVLEEQIVVHLEGKLGDLSSRLNGRAGVVEKAVLTTSFPLSETARAEFEKTFHAAIRDVPLAFRTDAAQSPGAILQMGGARIGWTIDSYLDELEAHLDLRLAQPDGSAEDRV